MLCKQVPFRNDDHDDPDAIARIELIKQRKQMALDRIRLAESQSGVNRDDFRTSQNEREEHYIAHIENNWREGINNVGLVLTLPPICFIIPEDS